MIRMIAGDLDKTLIGASGRLTDFTADVIRKYGFNIQGGNLMKRKPFRTDLPDNELIQIGITSFEFPQKKQFLRY